MVSIYMLFQEGKKETVYDFYRKTQNNLCIDMYVFSEFRFSFHCQQKYYNILKITMKDKNKRKQTRRIVNCRSLL